MKKNGKNFSGPTGAESLFPGTRPAKKRSEGRGAPEAKPASGARVVSGGGTGPGAEGLGAAGGYYAAMEAYYRRMYELAAAESDALAQEAAAQGRREAEARKQSVNRSYGDVNLQLYRDYMRALKALPQYLAATGLTGGAGESARVGLETDYGGRLHASERERLGALSEIENGAELAAYRAALRARQERSAAARTLERNLAELMRDRYSARQSYAGAIARLLAGRGDWSGLYRLLENA